jgi:hypothetical protein
VVYFAGKKSPVQLNPTNTIRVKLGPACSQELMRSIRTGVQLYVLNKKGSIRTSKKGAKFTNVALVFNSEELLIPVPEKANEYLLDIPYVKYSLFGVKR